MRLCLLLYYLYPIRPLSLFVLYYSEGLRCYRPLTRVRFPTSLSQWPWSAPDLLHGESPFIRTLLCIDDGLIVSKQSFIRPLLLGREREDDGNLKNGNRLNRIGFVFDRRSNRSSTLDVSSQRFPGPVSPRPSLTEHLYRLPLNACV